MPLGTCCPHSTTVLTKYGIADPLELRSDSHDIKVLHPCGFLRFMSFDKSVIQLKFVFRYNIIVVPPYCSCRTALIYDIAKESPSMQEVFTESVYSANKYMQDSISDHHTTPWVKLLYLHLLFHPACSTANAIANSLNRAMCYNILSRYSAKGGG